MGEHKHSNNRRVVFICMDCAYLAGKTDKNLNKKIARWYNSSCSICHRDKPVLAAEAWGFFTPDQAAQARYQLKALGLDRRSFANTADVKKLVGVVEMISKEGMSEAANAALHVVTDKLEKEQPVEMYDTKLLTYCMTQDVAARQELARVKAAKPKRKRKSGLVAVVNGMEREVDSDADGV